MYNKIRWNQWKYRRLGFMIFEKCVEFVWSLYRLFAWETMDKREILSRKRNGHENVLWVHLELAKYPKQSTTKVKEMKLASNKNTKKKDLRNNLQSHIRKRTCRAVYSDSGNGWKKCEYFIVYVVICLRSSNHFRCQWVPANFVMSTYVNVHHFISNQRMHSLFHNHHQPMLNQTDRQVQNSSVEMKRGKARRDINIISTTYREYSVIIFRL